MRGEGGSLFISHGSSFIVRESFYIFRLINYYFSSPINEKCMRVIKLIKNGVYNKEI